MTTYTFEELLPHLDLDDLPRCPNRTFSSMSLKHNPDLYKAAFLIHAELNVNDGSWLKVLALLHALLTA